MGIVSLTFMKIISPFKDYYDWVVFETDHRKIYNRTTLEVVFSKEEFDKNPAQYFLSHIPKRDLITEFPPSFENDVPETISACVHFCGYSYRGIYDCGSAKYYWDYNLIPNVKLYEKEYLRNRNKGTYINIPWEDKKLGLQLHDHIALQWFPKPDDIEDEKKKSWAYELNKKLKCPVILETPGKLVLNPRLSSIDFKLISPTDAYQLIYNFIEYEEPKIPADPTDISRLETKGFDKNRSFRPNMKK
jgi:hypothetical protein